MILLRIALYVAFFTWIRHTVKSVVVSSFLLTIQWKVHVPSSGCRKNSWQNISYKLFENVENFRHEKRQSQIKFVEIWHSALLQCEKLKFDSDLLDGHRASNVSAVGLDSCGYQSDWKEEVGRLRKTIGKDCARLIARLAEFPPYNSTKHY